MRKLLLLVSISFFGNDLFTQTLNFDWVDHLGEIYWEKGKSITVDQSGNVYTTGSFSGTIDFDPGPGIFNLSAPSNTHAFITKFDTNGKFIWAKSLQGLDVNGLSIKVDGSGNVYTVGTYVSTIDFDPGPGVSLGSLSDHFYVSKLDANGNFIWGKTIEITFTFTVAFNLALDTQGNVYVTGSYGPMTDFDPGPGTYILSTVDAGIDNFILKLSKDGNFIWAKSFGSQYKDEANGIAVDNSGNVYVTGVYSGSCDFDPGPGNYTLTSNLSWTAFVLKLDSAGVFLWAKRIETSSKAGGCSIAVDQNSNVYFGGYFFAGVDFDPGPGTYTIIGAGVDCFICKLDALGNFIWAKNFGGSADDFLSNINCDVSGNVYATGYFYTTADFDPGVGKFEITTAGDKDIYIVKLSSDGNFGWAKSMGGPLIDYGVSIAIDNVGSVYSIGAFEGTADFNPGPAVVNLNSLGYDDIYIQKLSRCTNTSFYNLNAVSCNTYTLNGHNYDTSGTYTQVLDNASGCDSIITLNLTINRKFNSINANICQGQTYFAGGLNQTISGIYIDTLHTSLGCDSIITTNLTVNANPLPNLGPDRNLCLNGPLSVTPGVFNKYLWQDNTTQANFIISSKGKYWVTVTNANNCSATDTLKVLAIDTIPKDFLPATQLLCLNTSLDLKVPGFKNYLWSTGEVSNSVSINNFGTYWLTVTDNHNCKGTDTFTVQKNNNCIPFGIPNAFSPNKDGLNDIFRPTIMQQITDYHFMVFNRYGQMIFETDKYGTGWDGTFKGIAQPRNSYVYMISFKNISGVSNELKGFVTLLR